MVGLLLIAAAAATALLAAYLAFVANLGLVTLALSPARAVTGAGLGLAEAALLTGALVVWWRRGRPGLPLDAARAAVRELLGSPVAALFVAVVAVALAYEPAQSRQ